jgi:uncharacterized protein
MRWRNGGGWTSEIIAWPRHDDWEWRLSVADIEHDGPFSAFPGVDRTIALLEGNGFELTATEHPGTSIEQRYEPFAFRGDETTTYTLVNGPVQDLNLMVRRAAEPRRLRFVEVTESIELINLEVAVVISGTIRCCEHTLSRLDAIRPTPRLPHAVVLSSETASAMLALVVREDC